MSGRRVPLPAAILEPRIVAVGRGLPADRVVRIAEGLAAGGIRAYEVTLTTPDALEAIAALARRGDPRLLVGAGTVLDVASAEAAVAAGAAFLVSPTFEPAVVAWAVEREIPVIPAGFSPTEILAAWRAGASAVKVFPASALGPSFVREMRGPLPEIPLLPTGGLNLDNGPAFLAAGAVAIGIGGWLIGDGEPEGIAERGARLVAALAG